MNWPAIRLMGAQSFKDSITGKWFLLFATVYFFLVLGVPVLALEAIRLLPTGYIQAWISTFLASAFTFIPLITLPMGATVVVDERESGTLQYIMSNPISKADFLVGRMSGMLLATMLVVIIGFGLADVFAYGGDFTKYGTLGLALVGALMLNGIMLALSFVVSVMSRRRATAVGIAVFLWFVFSVVSDVATLGLVSGCTQGCSGVAIPGLILDPVYTATSWAVVALGNSITENVAVSLVSTSTAFGNETGFVLMGIMVVWLAICLLVPFVLFSRRDVV
jgi:Cu-processing system permease protein